MILGIIAAQRPTVVSGGTLWTPLNMAVVPQIYLDANDSVVTEVSGFVSAISNLGAMGSNGDFTQAATPGRRPDLLPAELNGKDVLSFDGVDDVLLGTTTAQKDLFRNVSHAWLFCVYKKRGAGDANNKYILYTASNTSVARFAVLAGSAVNSRPFMIGKRLDADATLGSATAPADVEGYYAMTLFDINYATRAGRIWVDGAVVVTNSTLTASTGSTSNTASSTNLSIGALTDGTNKADIDLASFVTSNTAPSTDDIDRLFGWAAHKYGLTANLDSGHPYKTIPPVL